MVRVGGVLTDLSLRSTMFASAVDFPPMTNRNDQHHQALILDIADDAIVPHSVAPEMLEPGSLQG